MGFTCAQLAAAKSRNSEKDCATYQEELEAACRSIGAMRKRGVRILGGGDYGFSLTRHGQNATDIEHYVNLFGFSPQDAIRTMTSAGGQAMGLSDPVGEVKAGFLADLLLVLEDPLADVRVLQDPANFSAIMKNGEFHRRPVLVVANSKR